MQKFAPVCPAHIYGMMAANGYIPSSVLLLAHDVVENASVYSEIFQDFRWMNTTIFMDNSLVELKKAVDIKMVKDAVKITNAQVVILPDVMGDGKESTKLTCDAAQEWWWEFRDQQKLVVIHGRDLGEWLWSAEQLRALRPDWISIPRITEDVIGLNEFTHREDLVLFARSIYPGVPMHLLGFSNYVHWDLRAAAMPWVRSIDSAVPLRMNSCNIYSEPVQKRGDWWKEAEFHPKMIERCRNVDCVITELAADR